MDNDQYSATITAIGDDEERGHNVTVEFGMCSSYPNYYNYEICIDTYDVQSVSGTAIPGRVELSCTFVEGSQVKNCILTIYRTLQNGVEIFIANVTITRENPQTSRCVSNLELGEYVIRQVTEVESDGQVTIHRRRYVLSLMITEPAPTTTSESTMLTPGYLVIACK